MFLFITLLLLFRASSGTTTCCRPEAKERVVSVGYLGNLEKALEVFRGLGIVNSDNNWQQHPSGMKTTVIQSGDIFSVQNDKNGFDILDKFTTWKDEAAQVQDEFHMTLGKFGFKHLALDSKLVGNMFNSPTYFGQSGVYRTKLLQIVKGTEVITRSIVGGKVSAIFLHGGVPSSLLNAYSENGEVLIKKINGQANEILKQGPEVIQKVGYDLGNPIWGENGFLENEGMASGSQEILCNERLDDILDRFEVTHVVIAGGVPNEDQRCEGRVLPMGGLLSPRTFEFCDDGSVWSFQPQKKTKREQKCKSVLEQLPPKIPYKVGDSGTVRYVRIPPEGGFEGVERAVGNKMSSIKIGDVGYSKNGSTFPVLSETSKLILVLEYETITIHVLIFEKTTKVATVNLAYSWERTKENIRTFVSQHVPYPVHDDAIWIYTDTSAGKHSVGENPEDGADIYVDVPEEVFRYEPMGLTSTDIEYEIRGMPRIIYWPREDSYGNMSAGLEFKYPRIYAYVKKELEKKHMHFAVSSITRVDPIFDSNLNHSSFESPIESPIEWEVTFVAKAKIMYTLGAEPKEYTLEVDPKGKFGGVQNELAFQISSIAIDGVEFNIDSEDFPDLYDDLRLTLVQKVFTFNKPHDPVSKNGSSYTGKVIGIRDGICSQYKTEIGKIVGSTIRTIANSIAPCTNDDDVFIVFDGVIQVTWQVFTFNKPLDPVSKNGTGYTGKIIGIRDGICSQYMTEIGKIGGRSIANSIAPCTNDDDVFILFDGVIQVTWQVKYTLKGYKVGNGATMAIGDDAAVCFADITWPATRSRCANTFGNFIGGYTIGNFYASDQYDEEIIDLQKSDTSVWVLAEKGDDNHVVPQDSSKNGLSKKKVILLAVVLPLGVVVLGIGITLSLCWHRHKKCESEGVGLGPDIEFPSWVHRCGHTRDIHPEVKEET